MQGCMNYQKANDNERYIDVDDGKTVQVEATRVLKLLLKIEFYLDLNEIVIIPSFLQNLIFVSILDKFGYFVHLKMKILNCFMIEKLIGSGSYYITIIYI